MSLSKGRFLVVLVVVFGLLAFGLLKQRSSVDIEASEVYPAGPCATATLWITVGPPPTNTPTPPGGGTPTPQPTATSYPTATYTSGYTPRPTRTAGWSSTPRPTGTVTGAFWSATATGSPGASATPTGSGTPGEGIIDDFIGGGDESPLDQPILALATAFGAILPALLGLASAAPLVSWLISRLIQKPFWTLAWPRSKLSWGIVYDSMDKKPLGGVAVRIYSEPDGKLRDRQLSQKNGSFGFLVNPGKYSLTFSKDQFQFPSFAVKGVSDGQYQSLYHGETLTIGQSEPGRAPVNINVPLDKSDISTWDIAMVETFRTVKLFFAIIRFPLLVMGTIITLLSAYYYRTNLNYLFIALYAAVWTIEIYYLFRPRTHGLVVDSEGVPVPLALVRVKDQKNKICATSTTGNDGKFIFNLEPGIYQFITSKIGYVLSQTSPKEISKQTDYGKLKIELVKLSKG